MLLITQSVESIVVATDTAFLSAVLVTSTGSIIPALIILTCLPVTTSMPQPFLLAKVSVSKPALFSIVL